MAEPKLTLAEKAQIVRLELRGIRRACGGITDQPDVDRAVEAVYEKARKRATESK